MGGIFTSYLFIMISLLLIVGLVVLVGVVSKSGTTIQAHTKKERVPLLSPQIYLFLVRHGLMNSGPLTKAFVKALTFLNQHIANKDYKYSIPWYLILGPSSSGKSSILNSLADLHLPEQDANQTNFNGCEWFMFMNGIVMEVKDNIFAAASTKSIVNKDWQLLSMLLAYFRPRKPLDGVVLTLPVDFLKRDEKFPAEKKIIAQNMFDNLFWMQNTLNLRLPVYVILTKADLLEGFTNICLGMSSKEKEQMFGWSSSYSSDTAYSSVWLDEAFDYISAGLKKSVLKIAANAAVPETIENALYVSDDLSSLKENLRVFTNTIFSPNKVGVELILRGIYLTGSDFEDGRAGGSSTSTAALNPDFIPSLGRKSTLVNFVKDLFCEKIFLEKNIAQPILDNFVFHGTRVMTKRVIMSLFSLFLVLGFYFSNKHISSKAAEFAVTLTEIDSTLYNLKHNSGGDDLKNKTKRLLDYIFKLDPSQLYSFFVPISWFSNLRNEIRNVASNAFDNAIVKSMYSELENKATNITETLKVVLSNKIVLSPTEIPEFKALKNYIQRVVDLEKTGESYNKILLDDDEHAVENLAKFLYSDNVSSRNILKQRLKNDKSRFKEFDLSTRRADIIKNISTLQKAFVEHCFSDVVDRVFIGLVSSLENFLRDVEDPDKTVCLNKVFDLYKRIETVINFLNSDAINWWNSEHFHPGPAYDELLALMRQSSLIDERFIRTFKSYADAAFIDFKFRLSNISSVLTGHLIARGRFIIASAPSNGFRAFYNDLGKLLKQKFLINIEDQDIVTEIPDDKLLYWNKSLMQQCAKIIKGYKDFKHTSLKNYNVNMQPFYNDLSKKLVYNSAKSLIAKSQIIEDFSQNTSEIMEETALKKCSNDLEAVFSELLTVAEFFTNSFSSHFGQTDDFLKMVFLNYSRVLNTIDLIFRENEPFLARREMFDNWDGKSKPNTVGFGVSDQEELNSYIIAQVTRLDFLAKTLAAPVVNLLKTKYFNFEVNDIQINKWSDLVSAVDDYAKKIPGNSISALEGFLKNTLADFTVDNIISDNKLDAFLDVKKDFFLNKRAMIARYLKYRAQELTYVNSFILYNKIAKFFNEYIAGYFPFVKGYSNLFPDCGPEQLSRFLDEFKMIGTPTKKALSTLAGVNPNAKEALKFIEQIESITPFLYAWLQDYYRKTSAESGVAFKVEFRAEKSTEIGGDQIIDWRMKVGNEFVDYLEQDKMVLWNVGQEIRAIYQWSMDSNEVPHSDTKGLVDVMGQNAVFRCIGNWALIRLIRAHQAMEEAYPGAGVVLGFDIPTVYKQTFKPFRVAKVFCKIKFFEKNKDNWVAVKIPSFPSNAPIVEMRLNGSGIK